LLRPEESLELLYLLRVVFLNMLYVYHRHTFFSRAETFSHRTV
jgi:hypothetical protein